MVELTEDGMLMFPDIVKLSEEYKGIKTIKAIKKCICTTF